jgi:quinol monooxygenase YgiN
MSGLPHEVHGAVGDAIAIIADYVFEQDDIERAIALMRDAAMESRREEGCLHFAFSRDLLDGNAVHLIELWRDEAALSAHLETRQFGLFREALGELRFERVLRRGIFTIA